MNREKINQCVETLSLKGCAEVLEAIRLTEAGAQIPELAGLTDEERNTVLHELKSIMAVYAARKKPC